MGAVRVSRAFHARFGRLVNVGPECFQNAVKRHPRAFLNLSSFSPRPAGEQERSSKERAGELLSKNINSSR
jgi:hypothetical protein